jgi:hypothetical protein
LLKIDEMFKQTMIEPTICSSVQEAGFAFETSAEPYRIRFDEEKLRKTLAFQEIRALDFLRRNCRQDVEAQSLDGLTHLNQRE